MIKYMIIIVLLAMLVGCERTVYPDTPEPAGHKKTEPSKQSNYYVPEEDIWGWDE